MKRFLAVVLSLMLLFVVGCGSEPREATDVNLSKLTIGLMPDTDSIPFIIAAERGYFAEEGVEVELVPFKSAMERDAALQSGNLDGSNLRRDTRLDFNDTLHWDSGTQRFQSNSGHARLYGPNGEELGGQFSRSISGGASYRGAYGAKRVEP